VYGLRHDPIDYTRPALVGNNTSTSGDVTRHNSSVHMSVATSLKETILIDVSVPMYSIGILFLYFICA
jgi:hypothetical protein